MNYKFEKGALWWFNPVGVFVIVGFLWSFIYQICDRIFNLSRHSLNNWDSLGFVIGGIGALITIYVTRKEKMGSTADKFGLVLAVLLYMCLICVGLFNLL
ncbi:MAG: hypothetical protein HY952_10255 [Elusimicrobia bacterium]|nr:hypothetical protein [Elusimicrobiota bacterium]